MTWDKLMSLTPDRAETWINNATRKDLTECWISVMEDVWQASSGADLMEDLRELHRGNATPFAKDTLKDCRELLQFYYDEYMEEVE